MKRRIVAVGLVAGLAVAVIAGCSSPVPNERALLITADLPANFHAKETTTAKPGKTVHTPPEFSQACKTTQTLLSRITTPAAGSQRTFVQGNDGRDVRSWVGEPATIARNPEALRRAIAACSSFAIHANPSQTTRFHVAELPTLLGGSGIRLRLEWWVRDNPQTPETDPGDGPDETFEITLIWHGRLLAEVALNNTPDTTGPTLTDAQVTALAKAADRRLRAA